MAGENAEKDRVKQPYEAPVVVELGSFNTETAYTENGNKVEIGIQKVYYGVV